MGFLIIVTNTDKHDDICYLIARATDYKDAWSKARNVLGEYIEGNVPLIAGEKITYITIAREVTWIHLQEEET